MKTSDKYDTVFHVVKRIGTLRSLERVFDLIHEHHKNGDVPKYFCSQEEVLESQITLYIHLASFTCSFFDKRGVDVRSLDQGILSKRSIELLGEVDALWKPLEKPLMQIRNNFGFHGGSSPQIKQVCRASNRIEKEQLLVQLVGLWEKLHELAGQLKEDIVTEEA
jgi:hypothetical protein